MHSNVGQMGPFIWIQGLVCQVMFAHRLQVKSQQMHEKLMNYIIEAVTNRPEIESFVGIPHSKIIQKDNKWHSKSKCTFCPAVLTPWGRGIIKFVIIHLYVLPNTDTSFQFHQGYCVRNEPDTHAGQFVRMFESVGFSDVDTTTLSESVATNKSAMKWFVPIL